MSYIPGFLFLSVPWDILYFCPFTKTWNFASFFNFNNNDKLFILGLHCSPAPNPSVQFSSVAHSCPTLWDAMDCSMSGFPVHHQLSELAQTHVHPTILFSVIPFSPCLQSFPASGSFSMCQLFASDGQSIGVAASASVLPVNIQDWFPIGWTVWISSLSKGLSRVFSNTTVQKHQFFGAQLSL